MATNDAVLEHLATIRTAVNTAINNVHHYQSYNGEMTDGAKAVLLASVTIVPVDFQHASNCAICTSWDGSEE